MDDGPYAWMNTKRKPISRNLFANLDVFRSSLSRLLGHDAACLGKWFPTSIRLKFSSLSTSNPWWRRLNVPSRKPFTYTCSFSIQESRKLWFLYWEIAVEETTWEIRSKWEDLSYLVLQREYFTSVHACAIFFSYFTYTDRTCFYSLPSKTFIIKFSVQVTSPRFYRSCEM